MENAQGPGVRSYLCVKAGKEAGEGWEVLFCKNRLATVKQSDWCSGKLTPAEAGQSYEGERCLLLTTRLILRKSVHSFSTFILT